MKRSLFLLFSVVLLYSCSSSKHNYSSNSFNSAIKALNKNPADSSARNEVKAIYQREVNKHLSNIDVYETLTEPSRWDKILKEYNALQQLNGAVASSSAASKLVSPESYTAKIAVIKEKASAEYYEAALDIMMQGDVNSFRKAYDMFAKVNSYVPGYKDVRSKMEIARQNGVLNVVINPITDQTFFYRDMGPNRYGNSFNSDRLQTSLVRDLGGDFSRNNFARFYTNWEAQRARVDVDWVVDIMWTQLDIPRPYSQEYSKNLSRQIQVGKDTSGKPVYETVTGTLYVTRQYFTARGELEVRVTDAVSRMNVNLNRYSSNFDWEQRYATYRGDPRALTDEDRFLINNTSFRLPTKEMVLDELFRKIYPQVKNNIEYLVRKA